jgi:type III secretion protein L
MDLVVLIDQPGFTAVSAGRVLKQSEAASVTQADELLRRASERVRRLRSRLKQAHEEERVRARQDGELQAKQEWAARLAAVKAAHHVTLNDLAPLLVDIVFDAVTQVLGQTDPLQLMQSALQAVNGMLKQARWARLRVHPSQVETARLALAGFSADTVAVAQMLTVIPDASVPLQGCVFETDIGIADASLDLQLAAIRTAVESAVAELAQQRASGVALSQVLA